MARLPQPGGDAGQWGEILNEFLSQSISADGTLNTGIVGAVQLQPGSVTAVALSDGTVTSGKLADGSVTAAKVADGVIGEHQLADDAVTAEKAALFGLPGGFASLDSIGKLPEGQVPERLSTDQLRDAIGAYGSARRISALSIGIHPENTPTQNSDAFDVFFATNRRGWVLEFPVAANAEYKFARSLILGNACQIVGQGGMLLHQDTGGSILDYKPSVVLTFTAAVDGIVTDPNAVDRVQGPRVRGVLIRGSGPSNGRRGIALQPGNYADPAYRKVGLPSVTDVYIERFGVGLDFSTADSATLSNSHISDCDIGILNGQSECKVMHCSLWRIPLAVWRIDSAATSHHAMWFLHNEVEPESANGYGLHWKDVEKGVVEGNLGRTQIGTFAYLTGASKRIVFASNVAEVTKSMIKCDPTGAADALELIGNMAIATVNPAEEAFDLRGTTPGYHTVVGNGTAGTFSASLRMNTDGVVARSANRFPVVQFGNEPAITMETGVLPTGPAEVIDRRDAGAPSRTRRISAGTASRIAVERLIAQSTGAAVTGFGPSIEMAIRDTTVTTADQVRARITSAINSASTARSDLVFELFRDGVLAEAGRLLNSGGLRLMGVNGGTPEIQFGGDPSATAGLPRIMWGAGSPNGSKVASPGSIYLRTDGGAATSIYVKESGAETSTGWIAK